MSSVHSIPFETTTAEVSYLDEAGIEVEAECILLRVAIPTSEVQPLLAQYDPTSGTSPLVAVARPLARELLDELRRYTEEGPI